MSDLSSAQRDALDRYQHFQHRYPQLFAPRALRNIVTDRMELESYAAEHRIVLGIAAETPWFIFLIDLIEPESPGPRLAYSRLVYRGQLEGGTNVAVLGVVADPSLGEPGSIVLIEQERHATGRIELAIPRGSGHPGRSGAEHALEELAEETGFLGQEARLMGESHIDSGVTDARISFFRVDVMACRPPQPEQGEAIRGVRVMTPAELWAAIRRGEVTDSFTIQALALAGIRCPAP